MSAVGRYCCKSRFSPMTKIPRAVGATFAYKMRGTSRPHAKFTGDFGNAIEVIRISGRSLRSGFAKNLEPCNFRLLQHNPGLSGSHRGELALLWQNVFSPLFFKDLLSAMWALLGRRPKDEIDDGVTYGGHSRLRRRPVDSFFFAPRLRGDDVAGRRRQSLS